MQHIKEYKPNLYDHIAVHAFKLNDKNIKHHGIIFSINNDNIMESIVLNIDEHNNIFKLYHCKLDIFINGSSHLYVYKHNKNELNDNAIIKEKIIYYEEFNFKYHPLLQNCEDAVCDILLNTNSKHIKQFSTVTVQKNIFKVILLYTSMKSCLINNYINTLSHDNIYTDLNEKAIYIITDKQPTNIITKIINTIPFIFGFFSILL
jgi:hypothetical protein